MQHSKRTASYSNCSVKKFYEILCINSNFEKNSDCNRVRCWRHSPRLLSLVKVKYAVWIFPISLHVSLMIFGVCELNTKLLPPSSFVCGFVRHVLRSLSLLSFLLVSRIQRMTPRRLFISVITFYVLGVADSPFRLLGVSCLFLFRLVAIDLYLLRGLHAHTHAACKTILCSCMFSVCSNWAPMWM